jgi:hypothetical protein
MLQCTTLAALIAIFLLAGEACTKQPPPPAHSAARPERVAPTPADSTLTVMQKTFNLKGSATFPFEIPAHTAQPHLHGIFESSAGSGPGASSDNANIDFLILNQEQQTDFANHRDSPALFSLEASHNQAVNFDLPPSMNQPVKYYLVFRNPGGSKDSKVVQANFRVDF